MTIIYSAARNCLNVHAYLDDALRRVLNSQSDWVTLAEHTWKSEHPESLREQCQDASRQATDRIEIRLSQAQEASGAGGAPIAYS